MTAREIADLFEQLELHLIASLKRNLMRHRKQEQDEGGIGNVPEHWEAWQSAKLRDIRRFRRENEAILGQYRPVIDAETEALLREQYAEGGSDGFFHTSDERLRSLIHEMQHNEARVERAALRYMNDVYRKTILRTATAMTSGGMTYQQAIDEATKDFLAQGINCVEYANGRRVNIASYAEMALRTCSTRAMLLGEAKQRERLGIDTVLVSQYGACSDTCLPWQGRVYIDDVFQPYYGEPGGSFGISRNGRQYMRLSIAIQGGLFHPNCRHTISTWIEGISTMPEPMDPAKIEKVNKLEKTQRALERQVRRAKREAAGLTDETARKEAKARVRKAQEELREFIKKNSDVLRRDYWRERNDGVPKDWRTLHSVPEYHQTAKAYTDGNDRIDWPPKGQSITSEQYKELRMYAERKGVQIQGFKDSDASVDLIKDTLNDVDRMLQKYPKLRGSRKRLFTLSLDRYMRSVDFAEVREGSSHIMHLNADAYRSRQALDAEYRKLADEGWFVKGTTYPSIVFHETGHMASDVYGIDGMAIMKKILGTNSSAETLLWCRNNLSEYSAKSDGSEIIAEVFSAYYGSENSPQEIVDFMAECDKIILDRRGNI